MIKVSVLYPTTAGASFDADYYLTKHIPMIWEMFGPVIKGTSVEEGLAGSEPSFVMMVHFSVESVEAFEEVFNRNAEAILADIPKYTTIEPIMQYSEVKLAR